MTIATADPYVQWIAEKLVELSDEIPDFSFSGPEALGETWAFCFNTFRDDSKANKSRFYRKARSYEKAFKDDMRICRCRHWTHGWVEHLLVRLLTDDGTPTAAAVRVVEDLIDKHQAESYLDLARMIDNHEGGLKKPRPGTPVHPG